MADPMNLKVVVNGQRREAEVPPMARLLDVLRDDFKLTGTKEGCGEGECGACSVILDGRLVNSCLVPACQAQGGEITTIEGLARKDDLHPVQEAFVHHNGAQCGFCTPGMIMASVDLLGRDPEPSEAGIREGLAGNLCRCTGYNKIVDAVQMASREVMP
jgi:carbon-monoxide dehydrogenase small subunit